MSRATRQTQADVCNLGADAGRCAHAQRTRGRGAVCTSSRARYLKLDDVANYLSLSVPQVYSLVRSGELPGIKIGGRGVWRVDRAKLDAYLEQLEKETAAWAKSHPLSPRERGDLD